ncbi:hypothetical protein HAX54_046778 [Datura stramonium]|uniref:F-box associated beta-propeller type 3 domain-containing protein n=1 Tax=Datura stramonium TaxID=4076 RepID=A0ABS8WLD0_DATST|nr:hypothetical protein [Datura stramonium]
MKKVSRNKEKNRDYEEFPLQQLAPHHYFYRKEMQICSNHCNGLVCLYCLRITQVYLFNVTTGEIKALPFSMNEHPFCLGFDLVTEKYKLLHVFEKNNEDNRITKMRILTLGTKYSSWRILSMPSVISSSRCIYLKGVLYWAHFSRSYIFYFDLREEEFGVFSLPQEYSYFALLNDMQTALRGKLVMNCFNWKFEDTDWIYDELKRSFTKLKNSRIGRRCLCFRIERKDCE